MSKEKNSMPNHHVGLTPSSRRGGLVVHTIIYLSYKKTDT